MTGDKNNRKINEKFQTFNENKLMRGTKKSSKNSTLNIHREEDFHIPSEILESKILGGGSYQTPLKNLNNSKILEEGSYQTFLESLKATLWVYSAYFQEFFFSSKMQLI